MKNKIQKITSVSKLLLIILAGFILTSCVYDKEFARLNSRVSSLNLKTDSLQENSTETMNAVSAAQAEMLVELQNIRQSLMDLEKRVEDSEHIIQYSFERDLSEQDAIKYELSRIAEMSHKVEYIEKYLKQHHEQLGLGSIKIPAKLPAEQTYPEDLTAIETDGRTRDAALYETSLLLFNNKQYSRAVNGFRMFLEEFPESELTVDAQFWIGECYIALKQFDQAILAFQEVITRYPEKGRVPHAMLRQAAAWQEIGDRTSSEILLKNIIRQYPDSNEAALAKKRLNTM